MYTRAFNWANALLPIEPASGTLTLRRPVWFLVPSAPELWVHTHVIVAQGSQGSPGPVPITCHRKKILYMILTENINFLGISLTKICKTVMEKNINFN